jgi:hypothetical protein
MTTACIDEGARRRKPRATYSCLRRQLVRKLGPSLFDDDAHLVGNDADVFDFQQHLFLSSVNPGVASRSCLNTTPAIEVQSLINLYFQESETRSQAGVRNSAHNAGKLR